MHRERMHKGANIDLTTVEKAGSMKLAFSTTPRCINGTVAMLAEADEAEESEEMKGGRRRRMVI